jgi:hypothetical protein
MERYAIGTAYGGTGLTATPSNGQLPIGNGSGYSLATLTAGTNVSISNTAGGITISATPAAGGTVQSVDVSGGTTGLTTSGGPVTVTGTITLAGTLVVANGGTGATTLTGYLYGNGTSAMSASTTIPNTAITGLGTMSTQSARRVAITGGTINGTSIGATTTSTGAFTTVTATYWHLRRYILMAASGFTPISLYYSTTASAVPTSGNLANGELALNIADMKLYAKNSAGTVTLLASNSSTGATVSSVSGTGTVSGITLSGTVTSSGSLTLGGSLSLVSPPPIGSSTPNTGAFTTLSLTGDITQSSTTGRITYSNATTSGNGGLQNNTGGSYVLLYPSTHATKSNHTDIAGTLINLVVGGTIATVNSTGLGIGTTSPTQKLEVAGNILINTSGNPTMTVKTTGAGNNPLYRLQADTNYWDMLGVFSDANDTFRIRYNGTDYLTITNAGAFGVGSGISYGTAGQVLTSGGSGSAPTWATAGGGGTYSAFSFAGTTSNSFNV